jgi:hypothetical protein
MQLPGAPKLKWTVRPTPEQERGKINVMKLWQEGQESKRNLSLLQICFLYPRNSKFQP